MPPLGGSMPRDKIMMACALALLSALIMATMPIRVAAAPTSTILLQEDAEEATYDEWNVRWQRFDLNKDIVDGSVNEDWWCRLAHNTHDSAHAIYASRNGFNTHYGIPVTMPDGSIGYTQAWNVNVTGLPGTTPQSQWVPRYDTGQDSIMKKAVVGASAYNTVTLSFWFWSDTGRSDAKQPGDGSAVGYDFLNVLYWSNGNDAATKQVVWTDTELQASARTWIHATVNIPNDVDAIGFEFVSGTVAPEGGDASDAFSSSGVKIINGGMREGVYLDDIVLTGSDASADIPVSTSVDNLASVQDGRTFNVGFTANQPTAGFSHVNLYYRQGSSGDWTKYGGDFTTSPISFTAPSDGRYEFFTQGFDAAGGSEALRSAADAETIVDTTSPATTIGLTGTTTSDSTYAGSASFTLSASDGGSGVNSTYYRIDSSAWIRYSGAVTVTNGGPHLVQYYSVDLAGNVEATKSRAFTIETSNPVITFLEPGKQYTSGTASIGFRVTSGSDIAEILASLDGQKNSTVGLGVGAITYTNLTAGTHHVTIWARDSSDRWGQNMTAFTVTLGGAATSGANDSGMSLTLGALSASYKVGDTIHLTWECTANGTIGSFTVLVDGEVVATLGADTTSYDLARLTAGSHLITVMAVAGEEVVEKSVNVSVKADSSGSGPGSISQDMLIIGGIALFGLVAAGVLVFLRSRKMY